MKKDSSFAEWIQRGAEWIQRGIVERIQRGIVERIQRSARQITTEFVKSTIPDMTIDLFIDWAKMNGLKFIEKDSGNFGLQILEGSTVQEYITEDGVPVNYLAKGGSFVPELIPGSVIYVKYKNGPEITIIRVPKKPKISANQPT